MKRPLAYQNVCRFIYLKSSCWIEFQVDKEAVHRRYSWKYLDTQSEQRGNFQDLEGGPCKHKWMSIHSKSNWRVVESSLNNFCCHHIIGVHSVIAFTICDVMEISYVWAKLIQILDQPKFLSHKQDLTRPPQCFVHFTRDLANIHNPQTYDVNIKSLFDLCFIHVLVALSVSDSLTVPVAPVA